MTVVKYTFAPLYIGMKIEDGPTKFNPQWAKWFTDVDPLLKNLSKGVSGTVVAGGHTLTFTNGVLTSFV